MDKAKVTTYDNLKKAKAFQGLLRAQKQKLLKRAEDIFRSIYQNVSKLDQAEVCASKVLDHLENQILTQDADCCSEQVEKVEIAYVEEYANLADVEKRHKQYLQIDTVLESHRQSLKAAIDMAGEYLDTFEGGRESLHAVVTDFMRGEAAEEYKSDGIRMFAELEDNTARIRDILGMEASSSSAPTERRRSSRRLDASLLETSDEDFESSRRPSNEGRHSIPAGGVVDLAEDDDDSDEEEGEGLLGDKDGPNTGSFSANSSSSSGNSSKTHPLETLPCVMENEREHANKAERYNSKDTMSVAKNILAGLEDAAGSTGKGKKIEQGQQVLKLLGKKIITSSISSSSSNPPDSIVALDEAMSNYNDKGDHESIVQAPANTEKAGEYANTENKIDHEDSSNTNSQHDSSGDEDEEAEAEWEDSPVRQLAQETGEHGAEGRKRRPKGKAQRNSDDEQVDDAAGPPSKKSKGGAKKSGRKDHTVDLT